MILKILKVLKLFVLISLIVGKVQGDWGDWGTCQNIDGNSPYSTCGFETREWNSVSGSRMPDKDEKCDNEWIDYMKKKIVKKKFDQECAVTTRQLEVLGDEYNSRKRRPCHKPWKRNKWIGYTEDTDPDYIRKMTYFLFVEPESDQANGEQAFYEAQKRCVAFGAQLASITSTKEHELIKKQIVRLDPDQTKCWQLGLVRISGYKEYDHNGNREDNGWHWMDGSPKTWKITWHRKNLQPDPRHYNEPNDGYQNRTITPFESEGCIRVPKEDSDKGDIYDFHTPYERNHVPYICKKICTLTEKPWSDHQRNLQNLLKQN